MASKGKTMKQRNPLAMATRMMGKRIVKAKKGKGSYTRKGKSRP